jgi:hypothetical protein
MPKFDVADVHVKLGGDALNTVPKSGVTAAEIAVLQMIHGGDAVYDIRPTGQVERTQRVERERLKTIYGGAKDTDGNSHLERLYPGAAARVFETLDELNIVDELFATTARAGIGRSAAASELAASEAEDLAKALSGADLNAQPANLEPPASDDEADTEDEANGLEDLPADAPQASAFE